VNKCEAKGLPARSLFSDIVLPLLVLTVLIVCLNLSDRHTTENDMHTTVEKCVVLGSEFVVGTILKHGVVL